MPRDFFVFNELSLVGDSLGKEVLTTAVQSLLEIMKQAEAYGVKRLRVRPDFPFLLLLNGSLYREVFCSLDRDRRILLKRIIDAPYIVDDYLSDMFLDCRLIELAGNRGGYSEGVLCAWVTGAICLSFDGVGDWGKPCIPLVVLRESDRSAHSSSVLHVSKISHFFVHLPELMRFYCRSNGLIPSEGVPLPNIKCSLALLRDESGRSLSDVLMGMDVATRTARLQEIATRVALANGYRHEVRLSVLNSRRRNSLRQVFVSEFTRPGHEYYLSTDFEKAVGAFEFCDRNGRHLGEWLFAGTKNGEPDDEGAHNIIL